jgi:HEPN domain-containing protein
VSQNDAFEDLRHAEELLETAEATPTSGREAALAALRGLLEEWGEQPREDTVRGLLEQAATTDSALLELGPEAAVLDRFPEEPDSAERAERFVDAVRARLDNI